MHLQNLKRKVFPFYRSFRDLRADLDMFQTQGFSDFCMRHLGYFKGAFLLVFSLDQLFSNFFEVGTTFISQNVLRTTLLLGLSKSLGLP